MKLINRLLGLILVVIVMLFASFSYASVPLNLEQCVDSALNNNRNLKRQKLSGQNQQIEYQQARQNLLPNLNASAGQSFGFGRSINVNNVYESVNSSQTSFGISSGLVLFDGLRMKHNIDKQRVELKAAEADLEKLNDDIRINVTAVYLQVLLYKEMLENSKTQLDLTVKKIEQREKLIEEGKLAKGEIYELISQKSREELQLVQSENNVKLSLLDLAQIIEIVDFKNFDIEKPIDLLPMDPECNSAEEYYLKYYAGRPEIKAAQLRVESSKKSVSIAKAALYPSLNLGANLGTGYYNMSGRANSSFDQQIKDNFSTNVGFNLNVPIFSRFENKNNIKRAEIAVANSSLLLDDAKLEYRKNIEQAWYNAKAAKTRWESALKSEKVTKEAYNYMEIKFQNDRATTYELYQAKTNLAQVVSELTQSKYELLLRLKILELMK